MLSEFKKTGFRRLLNAFKCSVNAIYFLVKNETSFRQELLLAALLVPLAFYFGRSTLEIFILLSVLFLVILVEILNTAIEVIVDRIGVEYSEKSGLAKDIGSAAVFISIVFALFTWFIVLIIGIG